MREDHRCENTSGPGVSRREFVGLTLSGALATLFAHPAGMANASAAAGGNKTKRCILLWLDGGPSHIDTFDPKPGQTSGGPFKAIRTSVRGIQIAEHLPRVSGQMKEIALIRSLTSREGNHQRAKYLMHTGYMPQGAVVHPSLGSLLNHEVGAGNSKSALPGYVSIGGVRFGAGFLGADYAPLQVQNPGRPLENLNKPPSLSAERFERRLQLRNELDRTYAETRGGQASRDYAAVMDRAVRFMDAEEAKAFDISEEPEAVRQSYGNSRFGAGCLMARRLIEAGSRFVEVSLPGWDTHKDNFGRTEALCRDLDPAFASLIGDLRERDLLDDTLILCTGEFGRKPRINENEGRDHHPACWSVALAGGGIRGGQVIGATDDEGGSVIERPVSVADLYRTCCAILGMNPDVQNHTPQGRPIRIADEGEMVGELLANSA